MYQSVDMRKRSGAVDRCAKCQNRSKIVNHCFGKLLVLTNVLHIALVRLIGRWQSPLVEIHFSIVIIFWKLFVNVYWLFTWIKCVTCVDVFHDADLVLAFWMTILVAINNSLNCHELWSQKSKVGGVKEKKCLNKSINQWLSGPLLSKSARVCNPAWWHYDYVACLSVFLITDCKYSKESVFHVLTSLPHFFCGIMSMGGSRGGRQRVWTPPPLEKHNWL